MKRISTICLFGLLLLVLSCQSGQSIETSSLRNNRDIPLSRRGSILEVVSPSEILVQAYGEYYGQGSSIREQHKDVNEQGTDMALLDARRTAVYLLLFAGSDPLLSTERERLLFDQQSMYFYAPENLRRYITYEETLFSSRLLLEEGTAIRVSKRFTIHKDRLLADLTERNIIVGQTALLQTVGNPILMVLPDAQSSKSPISVLAEDVVARQSATVIQSYLTSKGYEVVVPEQSAELSQLISSQQITDYAYQLALAIGSDIYLTFSGYTEEGAYGTSRYVATLSAFETTTGRLLGSETGYSKERTGDDMVSVEEAFNGAIDRVITRIMNYWKSDMLKGIQYKFIVRLPEQIDAYDAESLQRAFLQAVSDISLSSRELIITDQTIDCLVWVDPDAYDRALGVYQALQDAFNRYGTGAALTRTSINRKLLQLVIRN
jgi:hypothetical protein